MSGNISQTQVHEVNGKKHFIKIKPVGSFNMQTIQFQCDLYNLYKFKYPDDNFKINKFKGFSYGDFKGKSCFHLTFEYINNIPWQISKDNINIVARAMARMHNLSRLNRKHIIDQIKLPIKDNKYDSIDAWNKIIDNAPNIIKQDAIKAKSMRHWIFNKIERLNLKQLKIPLHRDFKPHNILYDGRYFYLIDFDFAAIDYLSLEVMGFVVDILNQSLDLVVEFFKTYFKNLEFPVYANFFVDDYLNYLCTNTFPFYMHNQLDGISFNNLVNHRNESLTKLFENRNIINSIIKDNYYAHI